MMSLVIDLLVDNTVLLLWKYILLTSLLAVSAVTVQLLPQRGFHPDVRSRSSICTWWYYRRRKPDSCVAMLSSLRLQNRISTVITSLFVYKVKDLQEQQLIIMLSYKFALNLWEKMCFSLRTTKYDLFFICNVVVFLHASLHSLFNLYYSFVFIFFRKINTGHRLDDDWIMNHFQSTWSLTITAFTTPHIRAISQLYLNTYLYNSTGRSLERHIIKQMRR